MMVSLVLIELKCRTDKCCSIAVCSPEGWGESRGSAWTGKRPPLLSHICPLYAGIMKQTWFVCVLFK